MLSFQACQFRWRYARPLFRESLIAGHEDRYCQSPLDDADGCCKPFKVSVASVCGGCVVLLAFLVLAAIFTSSTIPVAAKVHGMESAPISLHGLAAGAQSQLYLSAPPHFPRPGVVAAASALPQQMPSLGTSISATGFGALDAYPPALRWGKAISSPLPSFELGTRLRRPHVPRAASPSVVAQEAAAKASKEAAQKQEELADAGELEESTQLERFPRDYNELIAQCHRAVEASIKDGKTLLEVEFPEFNLENYPPNGTKRENEMSASFAKQLIPSQFAEKSRFLFPDEDSHTRMTESGVFPEPPFAGKNFADNRYRTGFLTNNTELMRYRVYKDKVSSRFQPDDAMYVVAWSSFHIMEMLAAQELVADLEAQANLTKEKAKPVIWFNSLVDLPRYEYRWSVFYKEYMPRMEAAYYIRIFDTGSHPPGVVFRAYPGPWQVLKRDPQNPSTLWLVRTSDTMPRPIEVPAILKGSTEPRPAFLDSSER